MIIWFITPEKQKYKRIGKIESENLSKPNYVYRK